jgi:hypothetical protein
MAIEIVDLPIEHGDFPDIVMLVYHRVFDIVFGKSCEILFGEPS